MREPADKSLLTDVSRLRSYRCTIMVQSSLWSLWRAQDVARKVLDMWHKHEGVSQILPTIQLLARSKIRFFRNRDTVIE